ncbi:hypothetical protein Clacol_003585 [Clathrus columnatus]|uniref:Uncharacterized protein n=1 Tax=Clathrus columnatus TaxID=1419009 RepID=A0AAV5A7C2_9AGAM|nr:hypothetical protein Clacol_003585 [Clathrus columnatus]
MVNDDSTTRNGWEPFLIPTDDNIAWQVEDVEEEMFLLYSQLQGSFNEHLDDKDDDDASMESGLGSVNPREGQITITLPVCRCQTCSLRFSQKGSKKSQPQRFIPSSKDIILFQDTTALNSRKGDTGSVLWRASKKFARLILSEMLISHANLSTCQILEFGAGTGLLAMALGPLVKRYMATDLPPLIPLIDKNVAHNFPVVPPSILSETLDWTDFQSLSSNARLKAYKDVWIQDFPDSGPRIILVVDCVYNPSLIPPLLSVINHFASPETDEKKALVLVIIELRAEEVTRLFLSHWIDSGKWEIWSLRVLDARFAVWLGRLTS